MTREELMEHAGREVDAAFGHRKNRMMNLVQQVYCEGKRAAEMSAKQQGIVELYELKCAVDRILDIMSYDAKNLFGISNEKMAADKIRSMNVEEVLDAAKKIDDWVKEQIGAYTVGTVVRDPLGEACVITKIYTGATAGVMGGFHVLYADGCTNRWPVGTKFEVLNDDGGQLSDLSCIIAESDKKEKED